MITTKGLLNILYPREKTTTTFFASVHENLVDFAKSVSDMICKMLLFCH